MTTAKQWAALLMLAVVVGAGPALAGMEPQTRTAPPTSAAASAPTRRRRCERSARTIPCTCCSPRQVAAPTSPSVAVTIADRQGRTVFDAVSDGPFLFAKLPAGTYRLTASSDGRPIARSVTVPQSGSVEERFYWPPKP